MDIRYQVHVVGNIPNEKPRLNWQVLTWENPFLMEDFHLKPRVSFWYIAMPP